MRNASLDGIRGIAVLLVLFYHHNLLNFGWLGVDLFFVLSGYLITTILRKERMARHYWSSYWIKRATRIFPPLLLLLAAAAVLGVSLSLSQAFLYLASAGDLFAILRPHVESLRPLWSLAVEEHFYLLWPLAVYHLDAKTLKRICLALILLDPLARAIMSLFTQDWQIVYFLTPFRLDGLALGCLLALLFESNIAIERIRRMSSSATIAFVLAWLALRVILGHGFTRNNPTPAYNAFCYSLVALACAAGISYVLTHQHSFVSRVLSWRPIAYIGLISYGLYLYQVLIIESMQRWTGKSVHAVFLLDFPVCFVLAALSFRFYESPLIAWGRAKAKSHAERVIPKNAEQISEG
ncbi:MAG: acyltransferase [Edaphobacter sp.]|uniref:acyltransferase family protein n=1 Tax=Edaphobacter sp. TaxID=1934404 RepID=UPI00239C47F6|nr:acyltransferase [Edaphobacter sp.]MDE1178838.1 acyltransferase [Edaphobacter sp.]